MDRPNAEGAGGSPTDQESAAGAPANKRLRIVTRCASLDEFFATFGPFADETSLFIVTNKPRALGLVQPFVMQLKDGTTIMRGEVEVIQSTADGGGPDGRNGMRLKLLAADAPTIDIQRRLVEHSRGKGPSLPPRMKQRAPSRRSPQFRRDPETTQLARRRRAPALLARAGWSRQRRPAGTTPGLHLR
ncbi:MAG: hypothetical protein R3B70_08340 [Polyangiaceae bacterium]